MDNTWGLTSPWVHDLIQVLQHFLNTQKSNVLGLHSIQNGKYTEELMISSVFIIYLIYLFYPVLPVNLLKFTGNLPPLLIYR